MSENVQSEIRLAEKRLILRWSDGVEGSLDSRRLREACRCAECLSRSKEPSSTGLSIVEIRLLGSHAVTIGFSDGHMRGIFPFTYLRELAQ